MGKRIRGQKRDFALAIFLPTFPGQKKGKGKDETFLGKNKRTKKREQKIGQGKGQG